MAKEEDGPKGTEEVGRGHDSCEAMKRVWI